MSEQEIIHQSVAKAISKHYPIPWHVFYSLKRRWTWDIIIAATPVAITSCRAISDVILSWEALEKKRQ